MRKFFKYIVLILSISLLTGCSVIGGTVKNSGEGDEVDKIVRYATSKPNAKEQAFINKVSSLGKDGKLNVEGTECSAVYGDTCALAWKSEEDGYYFAVIKDANNMSDVEKTWDAVLSSSWGKVDNTSVVYDIKAVGEDIFELHFKDETSGYIDAKKIGARDKNISEAYFEIHDPLSKDVRAKAVSNFKNGYVWVDMADKEGYFSLYKTGDLENEKYDNYAGQFAIAQNLTSELRYCITVPNEDGILFYDNCFWCMDEKLRPESEGRFSKLLDFDELDMGTLWTGYLDDETRYIPEFSNGICPLITEKNGTLNFFYIDSKGNILSETSNLKSEKEITGYLNGDNKVRLKVTPVPFAPTQTPTPTLTPTNTPTPTFTPTPTDTPAPTPTPTDTPTPTPTPTKTPTPKPTKTPTPTPTKTPTPTPTFTPTPSPSPSPMPIPMLIDRDTENSSEVKKNPTSSDSNKPVDITKWTKITGKTTNYTTKKQYSYKPKTAGLYFFEISGVHSGAELLITIEDDKGYPVTDRENYRISKSGTVAALLEENTKYIITVENYKEYSEYMLSIYARKEIYMLDSGRYDDNLYSSGYKNTYFLAITEDARWTVNFEEVDASLNGNLAVQVIDDRGYEVINKKYLGWGDSCSFNLSGGKNYVLNIYSTDGNVGNYIFGLDH
ncbi:MAG: hypothetical protein K6G60_08655 [Lachnospiraceae bacterium]|nr:hypothetical protein [Lachnospiraceae bacterium]